jgi:hypothetical protein
LQVPRSIQAYPGASVAVMWEVLEVWEVSVVWEVLEVSVVSVVLEVLEVLEVLVVSVLWK